MLTNALGATNLPPVRAPRPGTMKSPALLASSFAVLASMLGGCTATKVPGEIKGEPVCADFKLGKAGVEMKGSLKKPVQVDIVEDGDEVIWERVLLGRRKASDPSFPFVVPDEDETYQVKWSQCPNVFAPHKVELDMRVEDLRRNYTCGETEPYATTELQVREGDASSRVIHWAPPPNPECWTGRMDAVPEEGKEEAEPEPEEPADDAAAGAGGASPALSASATPSASASAPPSASAPSPPPPPVPTPAPAPTSAPAPPSPTPAPSAG